MKLKPVTSYGSPRYAQRSDFVSNPQCLDDYIPDAWKSRGIVAGTIAAFFLSGCSSDNQGSTPRSGLHSVITVQPGGEAEQQEEPSPKAFDLPQVAPLFLHGDGTGATGCVMIAPPVFLTEAEACTLVCGMLKDAGLDLDVRNKTVNQVVFNKSPFPWDTLSSPTAVPLVLDAYSTGSNLGFEFVSIDDYFDLGGAPSGSTVQSYDVKERAQALRDSLEKSGTINAGVFYDPMPWYSIPIDSLWKMTPEEQQAQYQKLRDESISLLRLQVDDFIAWLRQQGILPNSSVRG